jgi:predicted DsbA family dithiol-disulfide isomerase
MSTLSFEYWTDPMCIWALIAQPRLERLLDHFRGQLAVQHKIVPVFGSFPQRFAPGGSWSKAGIEGRVATTARVAAQHGFPQVTGEVWGKHAVTSSWAPSLAIKAVTDMESQGLCKPEISGLYTWRLREAFFIDERNIMARSVQLEVAEELGLAREPIERRLDDGRAMALLWEDADERDRKRIQGSPTYVFDGGRAMLFGNFDEGVLRGTVQALLEGSAEGCSTCG